MTAEEKWLLKEKYAGQKSEAFLTDCERLRAGEPLGYVIGHIPFLNCTIFLDSRPLIPRTETEYWTEQAIIHMRQVANTVAQPLRVLDLCAGSGCIGVAVAKAIPNCNLTFAEIDPAHLPTIRKNIAANITHKNQSGSFSVLASDLFSHIPDGQLFNFILSNPPYIDPQRDRTEASVKNHEPHQALYGGQDGLALIEKILVEAPQYLVPQGQLWLEHEPEQAEAIANLATPLFTSSSCPDQYHQIRYTRLIKQA